jgi:hypothetical protein
MPRHSIRPWNVKSKQHLWISAGNTEMYCREIHSVSSRLSRLNTLVSIDVHRTEHKRIRQFFVLIRCPDTKLVPMSSEMNVSFHYAIKRHDRHITLEYATNARTLDTRRSTYGSTKPQQSVSF